MSQEWLEQLARDYDYYLNYGSGAEREAFKKMVASLGIIETIDYYYRKSQLEAV